MANRSSIVAAAASRVRRSASGSPARSPATSWTRAARPRSEQVPPGRRSPRRTPPAGPSWSVDAGPGHRRCNASTVLVIAGGVTCSTSASRLSGERPTEDQHRQRRGARSVQVHARVGGPHEPQQVHGRRVQPVRGRLRQNPSPRLPFHRGELIMALGALGQVHISVTDLDRSIPFYRDVLGIPFLFRVPGPPDGVLPGGRRPALSRHTGVTGVRRHSDALLPGRGHRRRAGPAHPGRGRGRRSPGGPSRRHRTSCGWPG